jgi:tetratricopeptide (TPR) repeat protein
MSDTESERHHYQLALGQLEEGGADESDDAIEHIRLGKVYAGIGRVKDAVSEADKAGQLGVPASRNYVLYRGQMRNRAEIYAAAGEHEKAIDLLEELLSGPGFSKHWYRLDPRFASLRDHSRFQVLVGE